MCLFTSSPPVLHNSSPGPFGGGTNQSRGFMSWFLIILIVWRARGWGRLTPCTTTFRPHPALFRPGDLHQVLHAPYPARPCEVPDLLRFLLTTGPPARTQLGKRNWEKLYTEPNDRLLLSASNLRQQQALPTGAPFAALSTGLVPFALSSDHVPEDDCVSLLMVSKSARAYMRT